MEEPTEHHPHSSSRRSLREVTQASRNSQSTEEIALWLVGSAVREANESFCITKPELDNGGPEIVFVNEAFTRITGYSYEEACGKTPRILQGPRTERAVLDRCRRLLSKGEDFEGETVNYRKDGTPFRMGWRVTAVRDQAGRIRHFLGVQRDVTAERQAEANRRRLEETIRQTGEAVMLFDADGCILFVNPAFEEATGCRSHDLLGCTLGELPLRATSRRVRVALLRALKTGSFYQGQFEILDNEGRRRFISASISPVSDQVGRLTGFVGVGQDITERLRLESVSEAVNMSESLGYVFSGIRHELGNPINSMKAALSVVRRNLGTFDQEKIESYLDHVLLEMTRVEELLKSMRSFTAFEKPMIESLDAGAFLDRFAKLSRSDLERQGVELIVQRPQALCSVAADPRALHQILLNLLANAVDAVKEVETPKVVLSVVSNNHCVRFAVQDNGIGLRPGLAERIKQPFFTTKEKGTGLGLTISEKLVSRMGGTLTFQKVAPTGCRSVVQLEIALNREGSS